QAEQLGVFFGGEEAGDILVGLAQAAHDLLVGLGPGVGEDQPLEPGVLGDAHPADVALFLHQLEDVGDGGAGDGKGPLDVPLEHLPVPAVVEVGQDPAVHGGDVLDAVLAAVVVDPAGDEVVDPAHLGGDDRGQVLGRV